MKKIIKKIKAWFKAINWKKVGCTALSIASAGIGILVVEMISVSLGDKRLSSKSYAMDIYNEAAEKMNSSGKIEELNAKWKDVDLVNDKAAFNQYDKECCKLFKGFLDDVAKEHAINGKMLDFDEDEPVTLKLIDKARGYFDAKINATIKNID